ncbi:potassium-transporting ATPase subunit KdpC [Pseudoflavonifractor sp. BIOML-A6]|nr:MULTISPECIES: potassium-transporting ATPase subunit KdpC [unclassified Pseudoflavonifractor]MTQ96090.1 potassium-transporting ATPase subunit KdpC [Pseudoflavonifractor sp. BIOML-A16]MTR06230.1 potassium-transporting ATPase subunit KdpC [Pseudoflavonifractor sp. BIOML-A15]MTR33489.1 potassium-transporting ATPase subunit KdpC [Pseudoflavonifractor sp. BIOML-A14]MTR73390.1 potassium-transporting ATPase subunit KdpC [Pseudoflavonifractor sp. BIOML-A18]MTS63934.1 potassium-transporting ATPase su
MKKTLLHAGGMLALMMVLCGFAYTLLITGVGQLLFPRQANGSVIEVDGRTYGSELLGQEFTGPEYLWGRIMNIDVDSFTDGNGERVMYAWASNLSPASPEYGALVAERVAALRAANPAMGGAPIPVDLVTCSGSGLDPDISPAAAEYQAARIAAARGITETEVRAAIDAATSGRLLGVFGEPRVNVLKVNLILDGILEG